MPQDVGPLKEKLRVRKTPTSLAQVAAEVGSSAFEEFEAELANETLVMRGGQPAALTPTTYVRLVDRIAARHGGKLP